MIIKPFKALFILGLCAAAVLCLFGRCSSAEELVKAEAALRVIFPSASSIEKREIILSQEQIDSVEGSAEISFAGAHSWKIIVYILKDADAVAGYAFEDTVNGKWGPIHYLVGLNPEGTVLQTIILDYHEKRGRPISKKRFLNQYKGKTIHDQVLLREDIDGITGATISSRSLTDGVRKILHIYELIKSPGSYGFESNTGK